MPPVPGVSGASFLFLAQVSTKLFTFVSNQLLVGSISPEVMGVVAVMEFYVSFVLFFSREAERLTIQRATGSTKKEVQQKIVNYAYLPLVISAALCTLGYYGVKDSSVLQTGFLLPLRPLAFLLLFVLIASELAIEPLYALNQYELNFRVRSTIESTAVFVKCLVTFVGVRLIKYYGTKNSSGWAVLSFLAGQLGYALVNVVGYLYHFKFRIPKVTKIQQKGNAFFFDPVLKKLYYTLSFQMLFKLVLTEGDKIMMGYLFDVSQQGTYAVITNYGSIIARLIFLPVEEMLRNLFTRVFAAEKPDARPAYATMGNLLTFYVYFSILLVLGGYFNGCFLLSILLGRSAAWRDSDLFSLFPRYILYLPFMAFNGILEAFQTSILKQSEITKYSYFMFFLTIVSSVVLVLLVRERQFGLAGLIIANITSMTLRIAYCLRSYIGFAKKQGIHLHEINIVRRIGWSVVYSIFAYFLQVRIIGHKSTSFKHFIISGAICFSCLVVFVLSEPKLIEDQFLAKMRRKRGMKTKEI